MIGNKLLKIIEQLQNANITPFNNNWNNIHDFTPVPGELNYGILNQVFIILFWFLKNNFQFLIIKF